MKIFVYGTLKRGYGNNALLRDAAFLGEAVTVRKFAMINHGVPFVIREQQLAPVAGELFDIGGNRATLNRLDRLESNGLLYDRITDMVNCGGKLHCASLYVRGPRAASWVDGDMCAINARGHLEWRGYQSGRGSGASSLKWDDSDLGWDNP